MSSSCSDARLPDAATCRRLAKVRRLMRDCFAQAITLADTPERTAAAREQLQKLGVEDCFEWVVAERRTKDKGGSIAGCRHSHVELAMRRALAQRPKVRMALICEDDLVWTKEALDTLARLADVVNPRPTADAASTPSGFTPDLIKLYGFVPQTLAHDDEAHPQHLAHDANGRRRHRWEARAEQRKVAAKRPPLLLQRAFTTSNLAYLISRPMMRRLVRIGADGYQCHIDWMMARMTTQSFLVHPAPVRPNDRLTSTIQWGRHALTQVAQHVYQRVLGQGVLDMWVSQWNAFRQRFGGYRPSTVIGWLDAAQPHNDERDRFLKDHGLPLPVFDRVHQTSRLLGAATDYVAQERKDAEVPPWPDANACMRIFHAGIETATGV